MAKQEPTAVEKRMGIPGERYVMQPERKNPFGGQIYRLILASSPFDMIDMFFDSPMEVDIYALGRGLIVVEKFDEEKQ